ncbi:hypothetical protein BC332_19943 [Capsicum chinense]|nr:hypothetical protein BC332_19943 [Capsicum chinense]
MPTWLKEHEPSPSLFLRIGIPFSRFYLLYNVNIGYLLILKTKYENHPEVFSERLELRAAQEELERYSNFFDLVESRLHSGLQHLEGINAEPARLTASTSRFSTRWESTRPVIFTGKPLEDDRIRVEVARNHCIRVAGALAISTAYNSPPRHPEAPANYEREKTEDASDAFSIGDG